MSAEKIGATLSLADAACAAWDVIVVGAGPAGAVLAQQLAPRGLRVLLTDRAEFPRAKVCGGCMNARTLEALRAAGLGGIVPALGALTLRGVEIVHGMRRGWIALHGSMALTRTALDASLVREAIRAGSDFISNINISIHESPGMPAAGWRELNARGGRDAAEAVLRGRLVIAADGVGSPLSARTLGTRPIVEPAARVGVGATIEADEAARCDAFPPEVISMACARQGYVGVVRAEAGRMIIAAALEPEWIARHQGLAGAVRAILDVNRLPWSDAFEMAAWRGTPALTSRPAALGAQRFLVAGDAGGYVEPFTGEGMAWAITGALALAPIAERAARGWSAEHLAAWQAEHGRLVRRRQWVCRAVKGVLRHPALLNTALWSLRQAPGWVAPLIRYSQQGPASLKRAEVAP